MKIYELISAENNRPKYEPALFRITYAIITADEKQHNCCNTVNTLTDGTDG